MVSLTVIKFACAIFLLASNSVSGITSFFFSEKKWKSSNSKFWRYFFSFSNCFSVGLFLGIALLGLYRNASTRIGNLQHVLAEENVFKEYPLSELILCIGIFFLCASEWIIRLGYSLIESYLKKKKPLSQKISEASVKLLDVQISSEEDLLDTHPNSIRLHDRRQSKVHFKSDDSFSFLKSIFILYAMSFHSILEAISFGLLESVNQVISMVLAMALHQSLCAGTLGFRLAHTSTTRASRCLAFCILFFYLLIQPSGTFIGIYLYEQSESPLPSFNASLSCSPTNTTCQNSLSHPNSNDMNHLPWTATLAVLQILASASFLYVIFIEMVPMENAKSSDSLPQEPLRSGHCPPNKLTTPLEKSICFSFAVSGFFLVAGLQFMHHHH